MDDALAQLTQNYHELNAALVDELFEEPSALEFMRYVARNRPFVVRNAASDWHAVHSWNLDFLQTAMEGEVVQVAVTPNGNADSVVELENGSLAFVEPEETHEGFGTFLEYVTEDARGRGNNEGTRPVKYAQTQNDNLRSEYSSLLEDVPHDIPFARIALQKQAEAVNMWIGSERSVTALHRDNYENIYVVIRGQKHFVLLSPLEMPCINEQLLPRARFVKNPQQNGVRGEFAINISEDNELVPVATWDPDEPCKRTTPYSHLAKPLRLTLNEGDMLYLPSMWYHKVSQTAGSEGFACAVNYWYDMDFGGQFWATNSFVRDVAQSNKQKR